MSAWTLPLLAGMFLGVPTLCGGFALVGFPMLYGWIAWRIASDVVAARSISVQNETV
jgi:hypothetical protein